MQNTVHYCSATPSLYTCYMRKRRVDWLSHLSNSSSEHRQGIDAAFKTRNMSFFELLTRIGIENDRLIEKALEGQTPPSAFPFLLQPRLSTLKYRASGCENTSADTDASGSII